MLPPDPSGLSISARVDAVAAQTITDFSSSTSSFLPATPTASRDSFPRFGKRRSSTTPMHIAVLPDIDSSLTSKFDKVELIGTGEFSQVFRVAKKQDAAASQNYFALPVTRSSPKTPLSDQVWAVKKSRNAYIGPRDRARKLQEVEILKSLGRSDYTMQLIDSWERHDHLYIQTEFCEEGSLDLFLDQVGRKARLDDFRIWKILLELSRNGQQIILATHDYVMLKWFDLLMDKGKEDHVRFHSLYRAPESSEIKIASTDDYLSINPNPIDEAFGFLINQEIENDMGSLGK